MTDELFKRLMFYVLWVVRTTAVVIAVLTLVGAQHRHGQVAGIATYDVKFDDGDCDRILHGAQALDQAAILRAKRVQVSFTCTYMYIYMYMTYARTT